VRTGPDLILATKPFASENVFKSWYYVISTLILLAAAILGTLWNIHVGAKLVCSVLTGLLILRSFVIYHDQQHHSILAKSWIAEGIMRVYGILTLNPSSVWRSSHNYHHKHNSKLRSAHIGSFPIMTKERFESIPRQQQRHYLFIRHPLTILFGYIFAFLYGMCLKPFLSSPKKHFDCLIALVLHATIGFLIAWNFGFSALLMTLILPCFLAYAIGSYLFYAQHNFPKVIFADHAGWTYEKAAMESSSYMKTGRIMSWFTANIGYHHVHHLNAKIPFYRLPETLKSIPELENAKTTTLWPRDILACLRLKVWDVHAQRMTAVGELPTKASTLSIAT
jgi:omega-6 fatty acid desaturase (delta-12 desaturase)